MFKKYKEYYKNIVSIDHDTIDHDTAEIDEDKDKDKPDFYEWLLDQNTHMSTYIHEASKIIDLFDISSYDNLELYDNVKIMNGPIDYKRLIEVMEKENFIFMNR